MPPMPKARTGNARPAAPTASCGSRPATARPLRDRGLGYLKLGHAHGARADIAQYLQRNPDAPDAASLREQLVELGGPGRPH